MQTRNKRISFLRWAGSKLQLLDPILGLIKQECLDFEDYYEPFLGSGAVFFKLKSKGLIPGTAYLSDINPELINAYTIVRDRPEELIAALNNLVDQFQEQPFLEAKKKFYYSVRAVEPFSEIDRATRTIFLNALCYNGLFRYNRRKKFDTPFGLQKISPRLQVQIRACSQLLQEAVLLTSGFDTTIRTAKPSSLIYCDPPFLPKGKSRQVDYGFPFRLEQYQFLKELAQSRSDCYFIISDGQHDFQEIWNGFDVRTVTTQRLIASQATQRGPCLETLVLKKPLLAPSESL